jgi:hypothetical protein
MRHSTAELFDNSPSKIAQRLLEVYPLEVLRNEYNVKGDTDQVTTAVVKNTTISDIKLDCLRLMGHCRQHVYLFAHELKAGQLPTEFFGQNVEEKEVLAETNDRVDQQYLLKLRYDFVEVISETAKPRWLTLWWPIRVIITPKLLQVRATIMERSTKLGKGIYFDSRTIDDAGIILSVKASFGAAHPVMPLDINKGVKALWDAKGMIDSSYAAHKTANSLDTSDMDRGHTIKKDAPDKFKKMMSEPLRKGVFFAEDGSLPDAFGTEPCEGRIAMRRYAEDAEAVTQLIELILKHNK